MRLFGSEKLMSVFKSLGVAENEQIEHKMLSSAIEKAQKKIEGNNYGIRKNLLEYDQVNNEQREIIYKERRRVLDGENMRESIYKMITDTVEHAVDMCISDDLDSEEWDLGELDSVLLPTIPLQPITKEKVKGLKKNQLKQNLKEEAVKLYEEKEAEFPEPEQLRELERVILLKVIDQKWMDHIDDMDQLRQGIGLQAYGQRDPKVEYKMQAYEMFDTMISAIQETTLRLLYHVRIEQKVEREQVAQVTGTNKDETGPKKPVQRAEKKVYPNDPCPCGSGKKYKKCCMNKAADKKEELTMAADRKKWLESYPEDPGCRIEGHIYLSDFYDREAIETDKLVYLALKHRAEFITMRETQEQKIKRRTYYLLKAFSRYAERCKAEDIRTFREYDDKYSIHYTSAEWLNYLIQLLEEQKLSAELKEVKSFCAGR